MRARVTATDTVTGAMNDEVRQAAPIHALIVADDPVYQSWLGKAAGDAIRFTLVQSHDANEARERVEAARPDLLFVEFTDPTTSQRAALIELVQESHWRMPVVGLARQENAEWVLSAMRAGARDFFVLGRDDETLSMQIGRLLRRRSTRQRRDDDNPVHKGKVFPVLGGQPNEGIAFLAEHLALALTDQLAEGERALLVDLSTPAGAASIFLNLSPTYSVLDAIRDAYRCDETLVETAFSKHASGLYVLSLPEDHLGRPDFDPANMLRLIEVLRGLFSTVVIAIDGHLPEVCLLGLVRLADRVVLASDQSILKSRHTKHLLRRLRQQECPTDRIGLVVDDYRRRLGLEPENLAELFELPLLATLTTENANRLVSMNSGEPMFTSARKDPFCAGVRLLAKTLLTDEAHPATASKGLFDRMFR